ncbi:trypsin-1-like [Oratosquilla oratoria]|uniref:trypsin-1-like n=1 Tax=Oratosquilla oratoria TaxID=337810 RepID=UPI003F75E6E4
MSVCRHIVSGALSSSCRSSCRPYREAPFRKGLQKIVGGSEAQPGEFKYQLSFQDISFGSEFHFCGASLYKNNYAISAAPCVDGEDYDNPSHLQVVAGEHNRDINEGTEQTAKLAKIIRHEHFSSWTFANDISLLKLETPLEFNEYVQPIDLPAQGQDSMGDCIVTGWGALFEGGSTTNKLMKVTAPIVTDEECRKSHGTSLVEDSMICGGYKDGGKDACQGDSGSPMACFYDDKLYLAGVVSWGNGCARPNYPGVYTEVFHFVDLIHKNAE